MSSLQTALDRFIEISGDRTGELGESIDTGLSWIDGNKLVLIADSGDAESHSAGSWRRASRIVGLARQLRKPLLLWNLSFHTAARKRPRLDTEGAAKDSQQHIIQFPAPVISVMENAQRTPFSAVELALPDGIIFANGAEALCRHLTISPRTLEVSGAEAIATGISALLAETAVIPSNELVTQRNRRLASIVLA